MAKRGKEYNKAKEQVEAFDYSLDDAIVLMKKIKYVKFDESVELVLNLGVDPKHADQMVRGTIVLPHGTGKTVRVCVIASGEKIAEAEEAGADVVGGDDLIERIQKGFLDFDAVIATPDMMRGVGKLGRSLGPKGLMPNPKAGTVTFDIKKAVSEIKAGRVEFRVDKTGIIHSGVGKLSFDEGQIRDNVSTFLQAVVSAKPPAAKGKYIRSIHMSSTMGPSIRLSENTVEK